MTFRPNIIACWPSLATAFGVKKDTMHDNSGNYHRMLAVSWDFSLRNTDTIRENTSPSSRRLPAIRQRFVVRNRIPTLRDISANQHAALFVKKGVTTRDISSSAQ